MITLNLKRLLGLQNSLIILIIVAFFNPLGKTLMAQNENLETIFIPFKKYTAPYREVAYCHLNKSTYIKGEMIGFKGYVLDKDLKVPSKLTKNLYCVITDNNNKIIKSKLVKVDHGFVNNVFTIDSLFTSGNYTFKAYTNWMNNFDEPNAFVESFKVIDPKVENTIKKTIPKNNLDAQFLPEGGHFVNLVKTNVGVILKNEDGFGVPNLEGDVYDSNKKLITTFKTNGLGIGKFILYPDINLNYLVKINHLDKVFEFKIDGIKPKGISVLVSSSKKGAALAFNTNESTLKDIKGKSFKLIFHNGKEAKGLNLAFNEKAVGKIVAYDELFPGINIFTLFDENNTPVLERTFFNYIGLNFFSTGIANDTKIKDSTHISLPLTKLTEASIGNSNISISVLPDGTKSYQRHHNIISYTHLQPYVNGFIENAQYYFTNIDTKKKYDLDNLLITQAWSSYNWENIFNNNITDSFVFEDGIVLKANQKNKRQRDFVLYPLKYNDGLVINLAKDENSFVVSSLYPEAVETLGVGTINRRGKANIPNLNTQFFPSKIPDHQNKFEALHPNQSTLTESTPKSQFALFNMEDTQLLDEVLIETNVKTLKINKLKEDAFSKVDVFDDTKRRMNLTLKTYINIYVPQYVATEVRGSIMISKRVKTSLVGLGIPAIYLDDRLMPYLDVFYNFDMSIVDYVSVNSSGAGEGFNGSDGVIRIYTSLDHIKKRERSAFKQLKFPLTFAMDKKFYVPKYDVYNDDFYKEYGVIDWIPNCKIDKTGNLNFTVYNPSNTNIKLLIEGVTDQGSFISEIKVVNTNNE